MEVSDLQNFGKVIDKGTILKLKESHNKANAGLVYKVHKNGQDRRYKMINIVTFNQLQSGETYVEHGIANLLELR